MRVRFLSVPAVVVAVVAFLGVAVAPAAASAGVFGSPSASLFASPSVVSLPSGGIEFGEEGSGAGQLYQPEGIAVSAANGDVYVADEFNDRVDVFSEAGAFLFAFGWKVDREKPEEKLQVCTEATGCQAGTSTSAHRGGELNRPVGIAVDGSGDVYVGDTGNDRVEKFSASGVFLLAFGGEVDEAGGDVCTVAAECRAGTPGAANGEIEPWHSPWLVVSVAAAGPTAGDVYVADGERVEVFSSGGVWQSNVPAPAGFGTVGWVLADDAGDVYVGAAGKTSGVVKLDSAGVEQGTARQLFGYPDAMTLGANETLILDEEENPHHLVDYASNGKVVTVFDGEGSYSGNGIAYSAASQDVFALTKTSARTVKVPPPGPLVLPGSVTVKPTAPGQADVEAKVNAESESEAAEYFVEYGETTGYGSVSAKQTLAAGFGDVKVLVPVEGLTPEHEYHYCLVAKDASYQPPCEDRTFVAAPTVSVEEQWSTDVNATAATLHAQVEAYGTATTYEFEYAPRAVFKTEVGAAPTNPTSAVMEVPAPVSGVPVVLSARVQSLAPGTEYVFRVRAHKGGFSKTGSETVLVTQPAESGPGTADARMWEYVGGGLSGNPVSLSESKTGQAAVDGGAVTYRTRVPSQAGVEGDRALERTQELARRSAAGWSVRDLTPKYACAAQLTLQAEYVFFSPDLGTSVVDPLCPGTLLSEEASENRTPYLRTEDAAGGVRYTPMVTDKSGYSDVWSGAELNEVPVAQGPEISYVAGGDAAHSIVTGQVPLAENAEAAALYEWSANAPAAERLTPVSVLPAGEGGAIVRGGLGAGSNNASGARGAVAADGSYVFWRNESTEAQGVLGGLYVRDVPAKTTLRLDAVQGGSGAGPVRPVYQFASADGKDVFFTDRQALTADATAGGLAGGADLYECELEEAGGELSCRLRDLTANVAVAGEAAGVQAQVDGVQTGEGWRIFLVADGALAEGGAHGACAENATVAESSIATCGLYELREEGGRWSTVYVATVSNHDELGWGLKGGVPTMTSRISDDGRFFAFMSDRSLTGYDNHDAVSGVADNEVFLYDARAGRVVCVSCTSTGARPTGVDGDAARLPFWNANGGQAVYQPDYLDDSGRLFFDSATPLVASDANGSTDAYEFEPSGVGSCSAGAGGYSSVTGGCVSLVSSGTAGGESVFLDASESGNDVFFVSEAGLVGLPANGLDKVYDAHSCEPGSSWSCASVESAVSPPCTTTSSCRGAVSPQPGVFGVSGTATFSGAGNPVPSSRPARKPRGLTRAQRRARALRACHRKRKRRRRLACERRVRRRYRARGARRSGKANASRRGR